MYFSPLQIAAGAEPAWQRPSPTDFKENEHRLCQQVLFAALLIARGPTTAKGSWFFENRAACQNSPNVLNCNC